MADEIVGSAYVVLRAITSKIKDDIRDGVKKGANSAKRDLEDAGKTIGETVGEAAGDAAGASLTDGIERRSKRDRGRHRLVGAGIGRSIASGMSRGTRNIGRVVSNALTKGGKLMESAKTIGGDIGRNIKKGLEGAKPSFGSLALPLLAAIVPLVTSSLSALTGALTAFIGSAAQASYVSFAFAGILGTLKQVTGVVKIAMGGLSEAIAGEEGAMKKLAPAAQGVVKAIKNLTPEWTNLKKTIQGKVFEDIGPLLEKVGEVTLPILQRGLGRTAEIMNSLFKSFGQWTTSESFVRKFGAALSGNNKIFSQLKQAALPLLRGLLNLYVALQPAALKLATAIKEGARNFRQWSAGEGLGERLTKMFNRGWIAAGRLWRIVRNLGSVLRNVFGAAVKPGDNLLKTFVKLTGRLKRFTELASTKNAIAEWARKGIDVSGRLFKGLGKGFKLIAPLFNPDVASGFFDVFEKAMPTIIRVVKVVQKALVPILKKVGDALAENGPKFAALFEALGPLLSGIGSVIGEIISQSLDMLGTIAAVITPVVAAISNFIGPILTKFAPIIAAIILAFTTWGGTLVKMIPIIGRFLAPLVKFASWLLKKLGPAVKFIGKIIGSTFKLIWSVVSRYIGFVSGIISRVFGFILKYVPSVVRNIAGAVGRFFGRIRDAVVNTVTRVWDRITTGFDRIVKFLGKLPGRVTTAVAGLWNGLRDGFKDVINWIIDKWNNLSFTIPKVDLGPLGSLGGGTINFPDIPRLATGGRATRGTLAVIGEGKEPESVLPDSVLGDLLERANTAGRNSSRGPMNVTNNIYNPAPERAGKSANQSIKDATTEAGWAA